MTMSLSCVLGRTSKLHDLPLFKAFLQMRLERKIELDKDLSAIYALSGVELEDRRMTEESKCSQSSSLVTTYVSDTEAYGVMFNVRTKHERLLIETLEISAVVLANRRGIHVLVYTKEGSYEDFHDSPEVWIKLVDTVLVPTKDGRGTLIPPSAFHPVEVAPRSQRAFYVTLDTADLLFFNSPGRAVGSVYTEDDFLQIDVGSSLLQYPFSSKVYSPRVFCGTVHYKRIMDCNTVVLVDTKVSLHFVIQHDSLNDDAIISEFSSIFDADIKALLESNVELLGFKESADLSLDSIVTLIRGTPFNAAAYAECVSNTIRVCTSVVTHMNFVHTDKLEAGDLTYLIFQHRAEVSSKLDSSDVMDVVYVGTIPVETDVAIRIQGVPAGNGMNTKQIAFFEKTTHSFLIDKLSRESSLSIFNVHVEDQKGSDSRRLVEGRHLQETKSTSSVDVIAKVTGALKPPLFVDFDVMIEDTISANAYYFIQALKNRRELSLDGDDAQYFSKISYVITTPTEDVTQSAETTSGSEGFGRWAAWLLLVLIILKIFAVVFFWRRRRERKLYGKEDFSHEQLAPEAIDLYEPDVYDLSYRDPVNEMDGLMGSSAYEGNPRIIGMRKVNSTQQGALSSSRRSLTKRSGDGNSTRSESTASSESTHSQRSFVQYAVSSRDASYENIGTQFLANSSGSDPLSGDSSSRQTFGIQSPANDPASINKLYQPSLTAISQADVFETREYGFSQRSLASGGSDANYAKSTDYVTSGQLREGKFQGVLDRMDSSTRVISGSSYFASENQSSVSTVVDTNASASDKTASSDVPLQDQDQGVDSLGMFNVSSFMRSAESLNASAGIQR